MLTNMERTSRFVRLEMFCLYKHLAQEFFQLWLGGWIENRQTDPNFRVWVAQERLSCLQKEGNNEKNPNVNINEKYDEISRAQWKTLRLKLFPELSAHLQNTNAMSNSHSLYIHLFRATVTQSKEHTTSADRNHTSVLTTPPKRCENPNCAQ